MSLAKQYQTSKKLESEGISVTFSDDVVIHMSRAGGSNQAYKKLFSKLIKPHKRMLDAGTLAEAIQLDILAEVYATTVILGWETFTPVEGDPLKNTFIDTIEFPDGELHTFTVDNCKRLLRELPDLFTDVQSQATELSNFQEQGEAEDVKPSKNTSDGASSGAKGKSS